MAIEGLAAVMVIDCSVAVVTMRAAELEVIPLCVAEMLTEPTLAPVTSPVELTVATAVLEEDQVAELVRF